MGPYESIFAEGFIYRQASEQPRSLIVVLGMWLMFGMVMLAGAMLIMIRAGAVWGLIGGGLDVISAAILWKTTKNYLARKKVDNKRDGSGQT